MEVVYLCVGAWVDSTWSPAIDAMRVVRGSMPHDADYTEAEYAPYLLDHTFKIELFEYVTQCKKMELSNSAIRFEIGGRPGDLRRNIPDLRDRRS